MGTKRRNNGCYQPKSSKKLKSQTSSTMEGAEDDKITSKVKVLKNVMEDSKPSKVSKSEITMGPRIIENAAMDMRAPNSSKLEDGNVNIGMVWYSVTAEDVLNEIKVEDPENITSPFLNVPVLETSAPIEDIVPVKDTKDVRVSKNCAKSTKKPVSVDVNFSKNSAKTSKKLVRVSKKSSKTAKFYCRPCDFSSGFYSVSDGRILSSRRICKIYIHQFTH